MIIFGGKVRVPRSVIILAIAANAAEILGIKNVRVTSGNDGLHAPDSKHYEDCALDFRTHDLPADNKLKFAWRDLILHRAGSDYVAILEDLGGENEHLHVQYGHKHD